MKIIFLLSALFINFVNSKETKNNSEPINNDTQPQIQEELKELTDSTFDSVIQRGKNNRWLVIFYNEKCYHCRRALKVLNHILETTDYKVVNSIKFAAVESENNPECSFRFNVSLVPFIVLIENGKILEMDLFPNQKNLKYFMEIDFSNKANELKNFPEKNIIKYYFKMLIQSLDYLIEEFNKFLEKKNVPIRLNLVMVILGYIIFCFVLWLSLISLYFKLCTSKEKDNQINNRVDKPMSPKENEKKDNNNKEKKD